MRRSIILYLLVIVFCTSGWAQLNTDNELYDINTGLQSRSISFENPTGEPGEGGKAASEIGIGRKGAPNKKINPFLFKKLANDFLRLSFYVRKRMKSKTIDDMNSLAAGLKEN